MRRLIAASLLTSLLTTAALATREAIPVSAVPADQMRPRGYLPFTFVYSPSPTGPVKAIGYDYRLRDAGNGWHQGTLKFAFENTSAGNIAGRVYRLSGATVETQEGISYPVSLDCYSFLGCPDVRASMELDFSDIPQMIPPGFRWRDTDVFLTFRCAAAAHPRRIVFPLEPALTITLADAAKSHPTFPADAAIQMFSVKPVSALRGRVLFDEPGGLRVTLDGTSRAGQGVGLDYTIVNRDRFHQREGCSDPLPILGYFAGEGDQSAEVDTGFAATGGIWPDVTVMYPDIKFEECFTAGPGQTVHGTEFLTYAWAASPELNGCIEIYSVWRDAPRTLDVYRVWDCH